MLIPRKVKAVAGMAIVLSIAVTLVSCRSTSGSVTLVEDLLQQARSLRSSQTIPNALRDLDGVIVDLKKIPAPRAEELAALKRAADLKLFYASADDAVALADRAAAKLPVESAATVNKLITIDRTKDPFFPDAEQLVTEMIKSTTCSLAFEGLTFDEAKWVKGHTRASYDRASAVMDGDATYKDASEFLSGRFVELGYQVADVERVFPTLAAVKRVYEIAHDTVGALDGIEKSKNPALTTRSFFFYFKLCVMP